MNLYATLDAAKSVLGLSATTYDAQLLEHLEDASRRIDTHCGRAFYTEDGTRYFDGRCGTKLYVDDFLSLTEVVTDSERDNTFDGETWTDGDDYVVWPDNRYPKIGLLALPDGSYAWEGYERYVKLVGTWGYGDGKRAQPWDSLTATGTVGTTTGTTLTLSASGEVEAGHTLLCEDEQLYVSAVSGTDATVERGVNGSTAAAHSGAALSIARYPVQVEKATPHIAIALFQRSGKGAYKSERIGDYQYTLATDSDMAEFMHRALLGLVREVV